MTTFAAQQTEQYYENTAEARIKAATATGDDFDWIYNAATGWQFGEAGMLLAITRQLGVTSGTFIEIGGGIDDPNTWTSSWFHMHGWVCGIIEADDSKALKIKAAAKANRMNQLMVTCETVTEKNVDQFVGSATAVSIDVDSIDYYIWEAMTEAPPVVMIEHHDLGNIKYPSGHYLPTREECFQKSEGWFENIPTYPAIDELAKTKGYTPVARTRVNSIYVRNDVVDKLRKDKVYAGKEPLRLNLGSGPITLPGYVNIDRRFGTEVYPLTDYANESVDEVRASHVLEHFDEKTMPLVVKEWVRVLKPGGKLKISVPDVRKWAEALLNGGTGDFNKVMFGAQTDENDYHKTGFDEAGLERIMRLNGLCCVEGWASEVRDCASMPISANLQAIKPYPTKRDVCMLMSSPRVLMKANMFPIMEVAMKRQLPFFDFGGAYWHQGIERLMRQHWDDHEWFLCIDYDTLFNVGHFDRICTIFEMNPQADALAPLQMRREESSILSGMDYQNDAGRLDLADVLPSNHAHFGFTLFRTEKLKQFAAWCKERKEPMMLEQCSPEYDWGDGRIDADMNFWKRWKEAGLKLYSTPCFGVGHIEEVGTWVNQEFGVHYQPVSKFHKEGIPAEARK